MIKPERLKRKIRVRSRIFGTKERPRMSVFRSNRFIYVQLIDDARGRTLLEAHGDDPEEIGAEISSKALKKKIKSVVFDRSGYRFHGKIKRVVEGAREKGLKI